MCFGRKNSKYLREGRLEDVLALIQVLALDKDSHRSEDGLRSKSVAAGPKTDYI